MIVKYNGVEYKTLKKDLYEIFPGIYGGNQHIGNKLLSVFGCGAVSLATFDSYIKSKPLTKDELISKQKKIFNRYLQGPISAYRFKLGVHLYYCRFKKEDLIVKVRYNFFKSIDSINKTLRLIKTSIDNDIPVPLIIGLKTRNKYKNNLKSHWVTITGYARNGNLLVSNNGRMEFINIKSLIENRLFIATIYINISRM